ncbi:MAG: L,D-transpeptidase family protein [Yoonia sp.]|nr:L,D-transpeptidase family protein [Yoonia sp.]
MVVVAAYFGGATSAQAQEATFRQAVAQAAAGDADLVAFYSARDFDGIWANDRKRRDALLAAFAEAGNHGLPMGRYDAQAAIDALRNSDSPAARGRAEVALSRLFLQYARDIQTGILVPSRIDSNIHRDVPYRSRLATIQAFEKSSPEGFLRALPPAAPEYARLLREKLALERVLANGGWGPGVENRKLAAGDTGPAVAALRNRLITMGYLARTASQTYDAEMISAVQQFQLAHGLNPDGTAGPSTLAEMNVEPAARLQSLIVAMERERWINRPRGERHIWVNLADFSAQIIDNDKVTFATRSIIGATAPDRASPEFSDVMEFMVINPSWYVPRSIITKEYLPMLQNNPNAVNQLILTDSRGQRVNRSEINFRAYTAANFPFSMREPPSQGNALGLVKFMFPNKYNIYLHDTPTKNLFQRETRAFSHGCIRLNDPFDFAYELLSRQVSDPEAFFQAHLRTGRERRVDLQQPVPVHLVYRTAYTKPDGRTQFRRDIYGRDARIWRALAREGVAVRAIRG